MLTAGFVPRVHIFVRILRFSTERRYVDTLTTGLGQLRALLSGDALNRAHRSTAARLLAAGEALLAVHTAFFAAVEVPLSTLPQRDASDGLSAPAGSAAAAAAASAPSAAPSDGVVCLQAAPLKTLLCAALRHLCGARLLSPLTDFALAWLEREGAARFLPPSFAALLVAPLSRVPRYKLLLGELAKQLRLDGAERARWGGADTAELLGLVELRLQAGAQAINERLRDRA